MTVIEHARESEAHIWHARKADGLSPQEHAEFSAWMESDPSNAEAYAEVEVLWGSLGLIELPSPSVASIHEEPALVTQSWLGTTVEAIRASVPRFAAASFSIALVAVLIFVTAPSEWFQLPSEPAPEKFATNADETKNIRLPDGSSIILGSGSTLLVTLDDDARRINLIKGNARFNVRSNNDRPFFVLTEVADIEVVGTRFGAYLRDGGLEVGVSEGVVELSPTALQSEAASAPIRLTAGDRIWTSDGVETRDLAARPSTKSSEVPLQASERYDVGQPESMRKTYSNASLQLLVDDLNEFADRPIAVAQDARTLQLSGSFDVTKPANVLRTLELSLPISVTDDGVRIIITSRALETTADNGDR
ncbi:MAG: FecR domain-containing protein [Pseudomonadota bacterium]